MDYINPLDSTTLKYRVIKNEGMGKNNTNTFYTFDDLIGKITDYINYKVEMAIGRKLIYTEYPDRDKTYQLLHKSDKQLADKTVLPRSVMLYESTSNADDIVDIPALKTHTTMSSGLTMEVMGIRKTRFDDNVIRALDAYRDIDVAMYGNLAYTSVSLYYTVLLDNRIETMELHKQLNINFPLNQLHDIYKLMVKTTDTSGKTDNTKVMVDNYKVVPLEAKAVIPPEIISKLKETFKISDTPETDEQLENLIRNYSYGGISREVDGSTRSVVWTTSYPIVPILIPLAIDKSNNVRNMKETSAVRAEFTLTYIEVVGYKLLCKYKVLSYEYQKNLLENSVGVDGVLTGHIKSDLLKINDKIDNCILYNELLIEIDPSDVNEKTGEVKVFIPDLLVERDEYLPLYMNELNQDVTVEDSLCYKVIVKHASAQTVDLTPGTSTGTYFNYEDMCIYDTKSKAGQKIYIIMYIDMKLYEAWKIRKGFTDRNINSQYLKRSGSGGRI